MAELILTPEEKAAASYLDWSDESLGKMVKRIGILLNDEYQENAAWVTAAAHLLIDMSIKTGGNSTTLKITGVKKNEEAIGDWEIRIRRAK
jgi:hypothetical protein